MKAVTGAAPEASSPTHRSPTDGNSLLALGHALDAPVLSLQDLASWTPVFGQIGLSDSSRLRCALARDAEHRLWLLQTDPFDTDVLAWACTRTDQADLALVSDATLNGWLTACEARMTALDSLQLAASGNHLDSIAPDVLSLRAIGTQDGPAVQLVNSTLYDAIKAGASDIHLESDAAGLAVKFRLDGVLGSVQRVDNREIATQAISRIKVMSHLDIAERRVPQDGRLQIGYEGRQVDVRVSIMPSIHGEDAVLRILDRQHLAQALAGLTLERLGFDTATVRTLHRLCRKPHGLMLVTGPTGSGKTTTLYAAISETHDVRDKIITIEDPVEYQLPGVLQIPVNERKGLTFARGLRSILRHDPDKILVGEIRDAETAQIAVQSALTGHLVFTTVHANNAFDAVGRFAQFGIDAYTFGAAVNGILAQRLMRRVCPHCARPAEVPDAPEDEEDRRALASTPTPTWRTAIGCEHCRGTGYLGRFALGEVLVMTPALRAAVAARAPLADLQALACTDGWQSLRRLALRAAAQGYTTLEEVDRVAS